MFEKEAEEIVKDYIIKNWDCLMQPCKTLEDCKDKELEFDEVVRLVKDGAEFGYNKADEEFKICEQNADTYYDQLQKAKQIIQEFLELNYSEFTKTNAVFLHADKFLKESK